MSCHVTTLKEKYNFLCSFEKNEHMSLMNCNAKSDLWFSLAVKKVGKSKKDEGGWLVAVGGSGH